MHAVVCSNHVVAAALKTSLTADAVQIVQPDEPHTLRKIEPVHIQGTSCQESENKLLLIVTFCLF